jgi:endonuclease YncB( thermonuclease family)
MTPLRARTLFGCALALVFAAIGLWLKNDPAVRAEGTRAHRPPAPRTTLQWQEFRNPELAAEPNNDGDSFLIHHTGGDHIVRLYFVDCCEKRRHPQNRARLAEQGAYFGGLSETDVIKLGRRARDEVLELLTSRPFRLFTRWDPVYDERRHYAHVSVTLADGTNQWLAEWLVERGLARIHTLGADLPDGTPESAVHTRLRAIEKSARLARRGGWGVAAPPSGDRE